MKKRVNQMMSDLDDMWYTGDKKGDSDEAKGCLEQVFYK
jgi:hypothetical protein